MGVLRPSGSLPARVYWTRRAVVLVVAVAVVVLLVVGVKALLGGGGDDATPDDPAAAAGPSSPPPAEDAEGTPACDPAAVGVDLAADAATYPGGAQPVFTVTLTNTGSAPCLLDAGDAQRQILVTSGSDRIWASSDCPSADTLKLLLGPAQADTRQVQWDRNRSVEGCTPDQGAARPGTYQAVLTVSGVSSEPVVFGLE